MADEKITRCPGCATVYRVTPEQLAVRGGQVRCGQCKTVFDGVAQQIGYTPSDEAETERRDAEGPAPAVVRETSPSLEPPAPTAAPDALMAAPDALMRPSAQDVAPPAIAGPAAAPALASDAAGFPAEPAPAAAPARLRTLAYALATVVLLAALGAQALYHFRDPIVAHWPAARPTLTQLCNAAGCSIRPLRDPAMSQLSIEASDLQADTAHRGLLILTATVRNRASWPVAYPHLELTLTDAQDRVVVRRVLNPADYASGTIDLQRGIGSNAEISLKVFIDASATAQAGYRLYMFYP